MFEPIRIARGGPRIQGAARNSRGGEPARRELEERTFSAPHRAPWSREHPGSLPWWPSAGGEGELGIELVEAEWHGIRLAIPRVVRQRRNGACASRSGHPRLFRGSELPDELDQRVEVEG